MNSLRVATWNINSVRLRRPILEDYIHKHQPDILCLQETKVVNQDFPTSFFQQLGYRYQEIAGMKSYNGVAILSKIPLTANPIRSWCSMHDCRHLSVELPGGLVIHNFYVPAGGDIPDPHLNKKFAHKLSFVREMADFLKSTHNTDQPVVILGDFNIAPSPFDVWSHQQLIDVVSHTPVEVDLLNSVQQSLNWVDAVRQFFPETQKLYSWWSYRATDWKKSNRGRRLDHIWVTPKLRPFLQKALIVEDARGWHTPSDHVPVQITLNLA